MPIKNKKKFHKDFAKALTFATELHRKQTRKATDIPYISHLIGVADIVLHHSGNRDEAIAALLHDAIEDQGSKYKDGCLKGVEGLRRRIRESFCDAVLQIVDGCTDSTEEEKPEWKPRKEKYLAHLVTASPSVRLVSCADKLYNAQAIQRDLRVMGNSLWQRFNGKRQGTLWYYRSLAKEFIERGPKPLALELDRTVREIERLAAKRV